MAMAFAFVSAFSKITFVVEKVSSDFRTRTSNFQLRTPCELIPHGFADPGTHPRGSSAQSLFYIVRLYLAGCELGWFNCPSLHHALHLPVGRPPGPR